MSEMSISAATIRLWVAVMKSMAAAKRAIQNRRIGMIPKRWMT